MEASEIAAFNERKMLSEAEFLDYGKGVVAPVFEDYKLAVSQPDENRHFSVRRIVLLVS